MGIVRVFFCMCDVARPCLRVPAASPAFAAQDSFKLVARAPCTMKRVYENKEFEAVASAATAAAPEEVKRKFHIPIVGKLTCAFAGAEKKKNPGAQDFIVWDTRIKFEWRLQSPRVEGVLTQRWTAREAMYIIPNKQFLPFRLKRPLVAAFLYKKLSAKESPLTEMRMSGSLAGKKLQIYSIGLSKPLTEQQLPFRKTVLKRRHGATFEAPICTRVDDKRSLAIAPNEIGTRTLFGFDRKLLKCIVDDDSRKKITSDSAAHAKVLELPDDIASYNRRPWRCLRDVVAAAQFTAEERLRLCALQ